MLFGSIVHEFKKACCVLEPQHWMLQFFSY